MKKAIKTMTESKADLNEKAKKYAEITVNFADHAFGITLDYSNRSIEIIEEILSTINESSKSDPNLKTTFRDRALCFGCYIGVTLIRNLKKGVKHIIHFVHFSRQSVVSFQREIFGD